MHVWADTFPRAAAGLSIAERRVLEHAPAAKPAWTAKNTVVSSDREGMMEMFSVKPSAAGQYVSPESAMKLSAVYRGVALIAGSIASLPCPIYRMEEDGSRASERGHPLWWLLNEQPTPRFSAATFWEFVTASMLLRGDGFAIIVRNRAGEPTELIPVPSQSVVVSRQDNRLIYAVLDLEDGKARGFDQDDVLHFPGFGFDGLRSMGVIRWGAWNSVGTALATEEYAGRYFANGSMPKVAITSPATMDQKQLDELRNLWTDRYGGADNSHRPLILGGGMTVTPVSVNADDAQLLASRAFQVEDIARALGIPPFMLGSTDKTTSWGSGVEHMGQGYVTYTLQPHLTRFQQEINRKIFRISRYFVEFNVAGLLRGDAAARSKYYREAIGGSQGPGYMVINEVRRLENLPPIPEGEQLYFPKGTSDAKPAETPPAPAE
jgi:HK97 family phage portal protein